MVTLAGIGAAFPERIGQAEIWDRHFAAQFTGAHRALAKRVFDNSGVDSRHCVVDPTVEDVSGWSTSRRMRRYQLEAVPLGRRAIEAALTEAGIGVAEVGSLVVCSCTGYAAPGLDVRLAHELGLGPDTRRLLIGHMGCYAALPGIDVAVGLAASTGRPAVLLCLELTTLHAQPPSRDPQQIVVHALFSDAAAAVVLLPGPRGYAVREVASVTDPVTADLMTWDITENGFRMGLSPKVPDVLAVHVRDLVDKLLARHGLGIGDVDGWAVHPGGPRILDVVRTELGLAESALAESRRVLAAHGNCSSPTVLLIVDALLRRSEPPSTVVALAFGPGLTLFAALLTAG